MNYLGTVLMIVGGGLIFSLISDCLINQLNFVVIGIVIFITGYFLFKKSVKNL